MYQLADNMSIYKYLINGDYTEVIYIQPLEFKRNKVVDIDLTLKIGETSKTVKSKEVVSAGTTELISDSMLQSLTGLSKDIKKSVNSIVILGNNITNIKDLNTLLYLGEKYNSLPIYKELYIEPVLSEDELEERKNYLKLAYDNKDSFLDPIAQAQYSSWEKSHDVLSARIPSQAFQSFMAMNNIAYTTGTSNDVYVSH